MLGIFDPLRQGMIKVAKSKKLRWLGLVGFFDLEKRRKGPILFFFKGIVFKGCPLGFREFFFWKAS